MTSPRGCGELPRPLLLTNLHVPKQASLLPVSVRPGCVACVSVLAGNQQRGLRALLQGDSRQTASRLFDPVCPCDKQPQPCGSPCTQSPTSYPWCYAVVEMMAPAPSADLILGCLKSRQLWHRGQHMWEMGSRIILNRRFMANTRSTFSGL